MRDKQWVLHASRPLRWLRLSAPTNASRLSSTGGVLSSGHEGKLQRFAMFTRAGVRNPRRGSRRQPEPSDLVHTNSCA